jgi:hypothetical protein
MMVIAGLGRQVARDIIVFVLRLSLTGDLPSKARSTLAPSLLMER